MTQPEQSDTATDVLDRTTKLRCELVELMDLCFESERGLHRLFEQTDNALRAAQVYVKTYGCRS